MDSFTFKAYYIDEAKGTVSFPYSLTHGKEHFEFTEILTLPKELAWNKVDTKTLAPLLDSLSLALGISYWKTFCPKQIFTPEISLSKQEAVFWNTVYTKGLGEFFYKNKIDFRGLVSFPHSENSKPVQKDFKHPDRMTHKLILLGGGKDSLVSVELAKKDKVPFSLYSLNGYTIQQETSELIGAPLLVMGRKIDPLLLELNARPDVWNGHIPITLVYSLTALLTAYLSGFSSVVVSTEKSANYGNVSYLGEMINHQWSKSKEFQDMFQDYLLNSGMTSVLYESPLSSLYEIKVVEMFSHYPGYFDVCTSCNRNFFITKKSDKRWCGECPKCAFVFLLCAAFIPKETLVAMFEKNLFADTNLLPLFRELMGLEAVKPFECVGTPEETKLAFLLAHKRGEYEDDPVMKLFLLG